RRILPAGALRCRPATGGLYLWCRLAADIDAHGLSQAAAVAGVAFVAGDHFYPDGAGTNELRLCFSSVAPPRIEEGVRRLGAVFDKTMLHSPKNSGTLPLV
ncbi:MAG TPA: hypothetical protein VKB09_00940, partial [Thermomicrobiales bacterium]|nr:hypothetical protein [Thermomicrobiales bacterium]